MGGIERGGCKERSNVFYGGGGGMGEMVGWERMGPRILMGGGVVGDGGSSSGGERESVGLWEGKLRVGWGFVKVGKIELFAS